MTVSTEFNWTKTGSSPNFALSFTDPDNSALVFTVVGSENSSNPASYTVTATLTGDDEGDGTVTRKRNMSMTTTMAGSVDAEDALTAPMLRNIEDWCREQAENMSNRPPGTAVKKPHDPRFD